jgi:hypothetical protein
MPSNQNHIKKFSVVFFSILLFNGLQAMEKTSPEVRYQQMPTSPYATQRSDKKDNPKGKEYALEVDSNAAKEDLVTISRTQVLKQRKNAAKNGCWCGCLCGCLTSIAFAAFAVNLAERYWPQNCWNIKVPRYGRCSNVEINCTALTTFQDLNDQTFSGISSSIFDEASIIRNPNCPSYCNRQLYFDDSSLKACYLKKNN